jgi:hypothetical protein
VKHPARVPGANLPLAHSVQAPAPPVEKKPALHCAANANTEKRNAHNETNPNEHSSSRELAIHDPARAAQSKGTRQMALVKQAAATDTEGTERARPSSPQDEALPEENEPPGHSSHAAAPVQWHTNKA